MRCRELLLVLSLALPVSATWAQVPAGTTAVKPAVSAGVAQGDISVALLKARLDALEQKVASLQTELANAKGEAALAGSAVSALQKKFLAHKHEYSTVSLNWENVRVVSSSRPLVEQEKYTYVSLVRGLSPQAAKTGLPSE